MDAIDPFKPYQPLMASHKQDTEDLVFRELEPSQSLSQVIYSFIQVRSSTSRIYSVAPDSLPTLFVGPERTLCASFTSQVIELPIKVGVDYFGIRFRPGALKQLFDVNLTSVREKLVDALCLGHANVGSLHQTLYGMTTFEQRVAYCESLISAIPYRRPPSSFVKALLIIYASRGNINISRDVVERLCVSSRQLNRTFTEYTGVSIKRFAEVVRAQAVCEFLHGAPQQSLRASSRYGYFDQSHLLKDFKSRFLAPPSVFFERFLSDFYNTSEK